MGGTISKYQNETLKAARKALNIGEDKTAKLVMWSTFSRISLQRSQTFAIGLKLAEILHHI